MRNLMITVLALTAACAPAPAPPAAPAAEAAATESTAAILSALTPIIAAEIGQGVLLEPEQVNQQGQWAWVWAQPRQLDGASIDWSKTALASRYENGAMDEAGGAYALMKQEAGEWRALAHVIAPTDVAWATWAEEYGAPAEIMGQTD